MPRLPRPDDLHRLRLPTEARLSPDGARIAFSLQEGSPGKDAYRTSLWIVPADGSAEPRRLTLGAKRDVSPRWSPDGRTLAFISDRGAVLAAGGAADRVLPSEAGTELRGANQVWLLPTDGGEASQLTRLPDDVTDLAWSPDGTRLCVVSAATRTDRVVARRSPGDPPERDVRLIDRLQYQLNGLGFIHDRAPNLWIVDVATGAPRRLTSGSSVDTLPAWSPDSRRICFVSNRHPDADLTWRTDVYLVEAEGGAPIRVTGGRGDRWFGHPAWSPDGSVIAALGHRMPTGASSRADVWLFRPERDDLGEDLTAASDREFAAIANSDLLGFSVVGPAWGPDGTWLVVAAPVEGSYELWRVGRIDGSVERLTRDRHVLSRPDAVVVADGLRIAAVRQTATASADVAVLEVAAPLQRAGRSTEARLVTHLMDEAWADVGITAPIERWHASDGRRIQGWFLEAARRSDGSPAPCVVEIHGGPATLYGWSMFWEWQCLLAAGISVYACNPRGSEGYGQDFIAANFRDWGHGPMADVMAGVDALVADGLVDPSALGVTGGSYGGYLTAWIIGHTDRFGAAVACRGVYDMTSEMLSGDIGGPLFGRYEYGANPWDDPELYRAHSPITYAAAMHTPLLIQHAEKDLRCPVTQAEELFTVLRSHRRPVRLMRTPDESHELTRSGKPWRRVENIERICDWFVHYLVERRRGLPPI